MTTEEKFRALIDEECTQFKIWVKNLTADELAKLNAFGCRNYASRVELSNAINAIAWELEACHHAWIYYAELVQAGETLDAIFERIADSVYRLMWRNS